MKVEMWDIAKVKPYENNPRHNHNAVNAVAKSIKEFGFRQPIVVDKDGIIVIGHTRWKAAKKLNLKEIPVHVALDMTPEQAKAYRIADNKTADLAQWNYDLLSIELNDLVQMNYNLETLSFTQEELDEILGDSVEKNVAHDPDDVPEPPDDPVTRPGDLWILGEHRLLCGDSSKPEDVDRLLDGVTIQLCDSDPPYNFRVEPRSNNAIAAALASGTMLHHQSRDLKITSARSKPTHKKARSKDRPLESDFISDEEFGRLLDAWFGNIARVLQPGGVFYIWGGYSNLENYPPVLKKHDLHFAQCIVWDKEYPVLGRKDFLGTFEIAFYGWKLGAAHKFYGPDNVTDLWHVKKIPPQNMIRLTEKPVELAVRAIQYSSLPGDNVLDLFGGSGSTLIAAEQTDRRAFLMEIDPLYCDVIVQRFESFTGKKAKRIAFGEK